MADRPIVLSQIMRHVSHGRATLATRRHHLPIAPPSAAQPLGVVADAFLNRANIQRRRYTDTSVPTVILTLYNSLYSCTIVLLSQISSYTPSCLSYYLLIFDLRVTDIARLL